MKKYPTDQCLNCEEKLAGDYCYRCGQKAIIRKLSLKHFVRHEVIHGVWHLEKGILYTLKATLTKPGTFAANYISGKRAGHFNLGTLLILLVGLFLYLSPGNWLSGVRFTFYDHDGGAFIKFAQHSLKWLLLIIVPVMAKLSTEVFKSLRYNYTEHLVMNGFYFAGFLCILIFFNLLHRVSGLAGLPLVILGLIACVVYLVAAYRQATATLYTHWRFTGLMILYLIGLPFYVAGVYFAIIVIYYNIAL